MRELIYYIATSLDGFIAHKDGSFDGFTWNEEFIVHLLSEFPETIPAHLKEERDSSYQKIETEIREINLALRWCKSSFELLRSEFDR